ncbi:LysR family transcriptional regulator [Spirillospora sp. CA-255316]
MTIDPTFAQLRAFVTVCEELHFGRAAARLHMTQPPLSKMIRSLETAVGSQLLARSSRKVEMTPAGESFLRDARVLIEQLARAKKTANEVARGIGVTYRVGYVETAAFEILGKALTDFRALHPGTQLELHELHTREQIDQLHSHQLDIGLVRTTVLGEPGLEFDDAYVDEMVLAVPHDYPITGDTVRLADLAHENFIVYHPKLGSGNLNATLQAAGAVDFTPHVNHAATSTPLLFSLVAAGEGVALVFERTAQVGRPGVRTLRIVDSTARARVIHAWRAGEDNEILACFRRLIRQHAQEAAPHALPGQTTTESAPR